jgi:hypothetical protein
MVRSAVTFNVPAMSASQREGDDREYQGAHGKDGSDRHTRPATARMIRTIRTTNRIVTRLMRGSFL